MSLIGNISLENKMIDIGHTRDTPSVVRMLLVFYFTFNLEDESGLISTST